MTITCRNASLSRRHASSRSMYASSSCSTTSFSAATRSRAGRPVRHRRCTSALRLCSAMGGRSGLSQWKGPSDTTCGP
uniref:Uncharacterized protein n=1 Tax=Arundo donax TaxID=35708 RepID=A0A0A9B621_ARUDO